VRLRRPVGDALGHGVGLRPDDVAAEIPAVGAEGEGEKPGDANEVFGFQAVDVFRLAALSVLWCHASIAADVVDSLALPPARVVRIPDVQPQRPVIPQHAPHLAEHFDHAGDICLGGGFEA
jgi:hypothetical protein